MGFLLRKFAAVASALILAGCAVGCVATPEPVAPVVVERYATLVTVQSIPRGAWIEVDGGYQGVAPIAVEVETSSSGRPRRVVVIRATDISSGAFEEKRFYGAPMPDKVLFDLRPWIAAPAGLTF